MTTAPTDHFHTIVIGAGSAGLTVAHGLARFGKRVALIEGHHVGGDCTNVGCIPSKTLIHLARKFQPGTNADDVLREVTRKRDALRARETEEVRHQENLTFLEGWASFVGPRTVVVRGSDGVERTLTAGRVVIATGSRPRPLSIPGLPPPRSLTNESLFDLTALPRHLTIVGAGIIAMEIAFAFRRLGARVTILALDPRPLPAAIPEASAVVQAALARQRITTHYEATAHAYDEATRTLTIRQGDREISVDDVDAVLIAIGRARNLERLGLENAGVRYDAQRGVAVDAFGQTNVKGIFAVGDATPTSAFTHAAQAQGRRVVQRIALPWLPPPRRMPSFPSATFSEPEVATVGWSPAAIAARLHPDAVRRIRVDLASTDRGYTDGIEGGFLIVDAVRLTGRILHVTIVGPSASEMISFFTLAIDRGVSLYRIYRLVYPYPTFSSTILAAADEFLRQTLGHPRRELSAYVRHRLAKPPARRPRA